MKVRLLLLALVLPGVLFGQTLAPREHPRLFFTSERIAALKQRLAVEKSSADAWATMLATANQALEKPGNAARSLEELSLAYRLTGDKRYATLVRDALRREI